MFEFVVSLLAAARVFFGTCRDTALELLAMRQQVVVLPSITKAGAWQRIGAAHAAKARMRLKVLDMKSAENSVLTSRFLWLAQSVRHWWP
ncbi:MAG: hypothetical protein FJW30_25035 [Acidobacteria bacterium]|nr:hypothetical protein [Acidobacteriota bacterium]